MIQRTRQREEHNFPRHVKLRAFNKPDRRTSPSWNPATRDRERHSRLGRKHGKAWRRGGRTGWGKLCGYGGNPMFKRVRLVGWAGTQLRMWPRKADDRRDPRWGTRRITGSSRLNTSLAPSSVSSSARHHPRPNPRPNPRPYSALNPRPDPSHVYCPGVEMRSERERERKGEDDGDGARD